MELHEYLEIMQSCGIEYRELTTKERWVAMQGWRGVFAAPLHAQTGKWKLGEFEYNALGGSYARALSGGRAQEAYRREQASAFFVVPEDERLPAFECHGGQLPDFNPVYADVYIWPQDLTWTMAFSHEANLMELGPFFSRREWAEQHPSLGERPN